MLCDPLGVPQSSPFDRALSWGVFLWKAAGTAFKFVGWCVLLGLPEYAYSKIGDWQLLLLLVPLAVLLLNAVIMIVGPALVGVGVLAGIQIRPRLPRWAAHAATSFTIPLLVGAAVFIALGVAGATVSVISTLH